MALNIFWIHARTRDINKFSYISLISAKIIFFPISRFSNKKGKGKLRLACIPPTFAPMNN